MYSSLRSWKGCFMERKELQKGLQFQGKAFRKRRSDVWWMKYMLELEKPFYKNSFLPPTPLALVISSWPLSLFWCHSCVAFLDEQFRSWQAWFSRFTFCEFFIQIVVHGLYACCTFTSKKLKTKKTLCSSNKKKSKTVTTSSIHFGIQSTSNKFSIMFYRLLKLGTRLNRKKS